MLDVAVNPKNCLSDIIGINLAWLGWETLHLFLTFSFYISIFLTPFIIPPFIFPSFFFFLRICPTPIPFYLSFLLLSLTLLHVPLFSPLPCFLLLSSRFLHLLTCKTAPLPSLGLPLWLLTSLFSPLNC